MKRFQIVLIVIPLLYWAGCGDDDNGDNEGNPVISGRTIYIVGSDDGGACYWVNGSRVELSGGAWATDIVVVDGTVYISGQADITTDYEACYWINQEIYELPGNGGEAEAIAVDGDDVYVAGWFNNGSCYWKNGERINLTTNGESQAFAIGVRNNGSVYIGGYFMNNHHYIIPCFWKNGGNRTNLAIPSGGDGDVFEDPPNVPGARGSDDPWIEGQQIGGIEEEQGGGQHVAPPGGEGANPAPTREEIPEVIEVDDGFDLPATARERRILAFKRKKATRDCRPRMAQWRTGVLSTYVSTLRHYDHQIKQSAD